MANSVEWKNRILIWQKTLREQFYTPLSELSVSGFTTFEQFTAGQAAGMLFRPMPEGTRWGAKWEYGWFKAEAVLPAEAKGRRIALRMNVGGECAAYIDGAHAGAYDREHTEITLSESGVPGEKYEILIESYAGHGPRECDALPNTPGHINIPEPGPAQAEVGKSTFGIWDEEAYQLWLDVETLRQAAEGMDQDSLRVAEIDKALRQFTLTVDFEQDYEKRLNSYKAARALLKPLLACRNGSTSPTLFVFGHSHIDVAWLWPLPETERKCTRTFATQMALMDEYPEYKFLQSQPYLYWRVKNQYPALYEKIREKVKAGQLIPEGAMWVEADTNLTGGESLIRQMIHGKRFFREEFGVDNELLWLPDVFGYSGALPQIMKGCGIRYFSTQKLSWLYNGAEKFPYNTFVWQGIDGTGILSHIHNDYNARTEPRELMGRWKNRVQKEGITAFLYPFGYGDGGGGATREHLEYLRRTGDLEGVPKTRMCSPVEFFTYTEKKEYPTVKYEGELYFPSHRGTYTSQAKTKKGNRKSEFALREAELWGVAAQALKGYAFPLAKTDLLWKSLLLHQFHDIIPGSSIHRVYEEAGEAFGKNIAGAEEIVGEAMDCLKKTDAGVTVFNSLGWERKELVEVPEGFAGAPVQEAGGKRYAQVTVPPCGWATLAEAVKLAEPAGCVSAAKNLLENELLKISFNEKGEIISIYDKEQGREWADGPCNSFRMFKDITNCFDAWDIDSMYEQQPVELPENADIRVLAQGPLFATLGVERKLNDSLVRQEITLRSGSRRVDFKTVVDWQETHKLLKVAFPVAVHTEEALHEIQFGHIKRPTHRNRKFDADRFEVCAHKWSALAEENGGAALLNDCKYGVSALGGTLSLTLLKSAIAPDMTADKGRQEFTYAFYAWNGSFGQSNVVREAYELNCPVKAMAGGAGTMSLFRVDAPDVVIETVKPAEDGSGDFVVRLYEAKRMTVQCTLTTELPAREVWQTNMLEEKQRGLAMHSGAVRLQFRPFEIKTLRFAVNK